MWSIFFALIPGAFMVDTSKFKTCQQSGFCVRQSAFADVADLGKLNLEWVASDWQFKEESVLGKLKMNPEEGSFDFEFTFMDEIARFKMNPHGEDRYEFPFSLEPVQNVRYKHELKENLVKVMWGSSRLEITSKPFSFHIFVNDQPAISFNKRGYLYHESKEGPKFAAPVEGADAALEELKAKLLSNLSSETFGGSTDSKPHGATSMGFDLSFEGSQHVFGIPDHATSFALKSTRGPDQEYKEPYRLYNLDVFEHILDSPMALYGHVPFMMSHKIGLTTAALFLNPSEMWIDIEKVAGSTATHWMAESGVMDVFFFVGPTQNDIFNAYTRLTGRPQLPQQFAVAHHSCRWNYNDDADARQVDAGFDENLIPYDVLWLDIEHTDDKRYFTWDRIKFPDPVGLQKRISDKGRKMVTIIDPHIKKDSAYYVSKGAADADIFVKDKDGKVFDGNCWPGQSNWIDYSNPKAREFWAQQFDYEKYKDSTPTLYTWNDMNEPSVFSGPEITMPKDMIHYGNVEHRDIHNGYGMLLHRSTFEGHLRRSGNKDRPFVLSRAFFVGTQRYGAIWTGDNTADWKYLAASIPMTLSVSIAGITFCGADVGGFFGNPDPELLTRWYQLGAFQPFFRAHAELTTKRREPWLFGEPYTSLIRKAIERRYKLLPYVYSLFAESNRNGSPIVRSMMQEFPNDEKTFGMDNQFMLGPALIINPVSSAGQESASTYLGSKMTWYLYEDFSPVKVDKNGFTNLKTTMETVPVYLKGGSIIPRKDRIRRSSAAMVQDPFTLIVAPHNGEAVGNIYVDDGSSFKYQQGDYINMEFNYSDHILSSKPVELNGIKMKPSDIYNTRIERIIVLGVSKALNIVSETGQTFEYFMENGNLVIKNPNLLIGSQWSIQIQI